MTHFVNGEWTSKENANVSVFDLTFSRGYGLFDFLRTYKRKPFMLEEHLDRFFQGASDLELTSNLNREQITELIHEGIRRNDYEDLYIKLYLTGGISEDAMTPGISSFILLFLPSKTYPEEFYSDGIKLISVEYERYIPEVKSLNYMAAVVYHRKAKKVGAQEVIYFGRDGNLLEGSTVNFFAVKDGKLYTPSDKILYGITRKFILGLCKDHHVEVVLADINKKDLGHFDEAFIASTTREICPVVRVDDQQISNGKVGPLTVKLMALFKEKVALL